MTVLGGQDVMERTMDGWMDDCWDLDADSSISSVQMAMLGMANGGVEGTADLGL